MTRPLVSVLTGTWQRHALLAGCIENVRQQTYRPLEHVIVSDGPDAELHAVLSDSLYTQDPTCAREDWVPIITQQLGRNWSSFLTNSRNAAPFLVANYLAAGAYQVWLADDERFLVPDYLERMVAILERDGVDFVYPNVEVWYKDRPGTAFVIGSDPPVRGQVTHALHRADILDIPGGGFRTHVGSASDWDQFERWMNAGKTWTHVPETLLRHRIDG